MRPPVRLGQAALLLGPDRGQPVVGVREADVGVHQPGELGERVVMVGGHQREQRVDGPVEQHGEDLALAGEMAVDGRTADACGPADLVDADPVEAALEEQLLGSVGDALVAAAPRAGHPVTRPGAGR
jgi:hypothetical protein